MWINIPFQDNSKYPEMSICLWGVVVTLNEQIGTQRECDRRKYGGQIRATFKMIHSSTRRTEQRFICSRNALAGRSGSENGSKAERLLFLARDAECHRDEFIVSANDQLEVVPWRKLFQNGVEMPQRMNQLTVRKDNQIVGSETELSCL